MTNTERIQAHNAELRKAIEMAENLPDAGGGGGSSDEGWIGDGNTHIWIGLQEGRTEPYLRVCVKGSVTVDWGDGSNPDTLSGTSTTTVTGTTHQYDKAGDYVITLTGGELGFQYGSNVFLLSLYNSKASAHNDVYKSAVKKIEFGGNTALVGQNAAYGCYSLTGIKLPEGVTNIADSAFRDCYSLRRVDIPSGVASVGSQAFYNCYSIESVTIPESIRSMGVGVFYNCYSLDNLDIVDGATSVGVTTFLGCNSLESVTIPGSVTSIESSAFNSCYGLCRVTIQEGVQSIGANAFQGCRSLASVKFPASITRIENGAFYTCYGVAFYDFSQHTTVPALENTSAFNGIRDDCRFRVPAALVDEWKAATNWSTYANIIVGV